MHTCIGCHFGLWEFALYQSTQCTIGWWMAYLGRKSLFTSKIPNIANMAMIINQPYISFIDTMSDCCCTMPYNCPTGKCDAIGLTLSSPISNNLVLLPIATLSQRLSTAPPNAPAILALKNPWIHTVSKKWLNGIFDNAVSSIIAARFCAHHYQYNKSLKNLTSPTNRLLENFFNVIVVYLRLTFDDNK